MLWVLRIQGKYDVALLDSHSPVYNRKARGNVDVVADALIHSAQWGYSLGELHEEHRPGGIWIPMQDETLQNTVGKATGPFQ